MSKIKINPLCWSAFQAVVNSIIDVDARLISVSFTDNLGNLVCVWDSEGGFIPNPVSLSDLDGMPDICANEHFNIKVCGFAVPCVSTKDYQPKIKMTKELPAETSQMYFWAPRKSMKPVIGTLLDSGMFLLGGLADITPADMGGYWAKVDKDKFEFEG